MQLDFEMLTPTTLPEALKMMASGPDRLPIAGGTNVVVSLRDGAHAGRVLVDTSKLDDLKEIRLEDDQVVVGGGVTIVRLLEMPLQVYLLQNFFDEQMLVVKMIKANAIYD